MGSGTVVSCDAGRLNWARIALGRLTRDQIYSAETVAAVSAGIARDGQLLAGPDLKLVCIDEDLRAIPALPPAVELDVPRRLDGADSALTNLSAAIDR
jgi:hypothetical protein